jgi:hypothetical protein
MFMMMHLARNGAHSDWLYARSVPVVSILAIDFGARLFQRELVPPFTRLAVIGDCSSIKAVIFSTITDAGSRQPNSKIRNRETKSRHAVSVTADCGMLLLKDC